MEELELICFQLITFAGEAKSAYMNAIQRAKLGYYEEAENLIQEGNVNDLQVFEWEIHPVFHNYVANIVKNQSFFR